MKLTFKLIPVCGQAVRNGQKTQHRIPSNSPDAQALIVGDVLDFVEKAPHGQTKAIASKRVSGLHLQHLDSISDEEIRAEGFPNWSVLAYEWNSMFREKENSWDVNPEVLVICFGDID
ncbi:hypothetical protein [Pseudomonas syringae]|uniref:hypothetical protein n=1 Tax=Pseudomonas syringae TaxID=317 RepID=UPI00245AEA68|nr:hypothetical protein [Pseudomonas syringae]MDH4602356.1 hypothetical protein [Pseudomonas syringae pv. papulans]